MNDSKSYMLLSLSYSALLHTW